MFVPLTPLTFKRRAIQLYGNKIGVVDGQRRFTYAEFGERTHRLANAVISRGLKPGDRVAYLAYNSYPLLEGYFGVVEAGGILVPLNIRLSSNDLAYILDHSGATFLFVDRDFEPLVSKIQPLLRQSPEIIWLSGANNDNTVIYDMMLDNASPSPPPTPEFDENDTAELFYTSGTTGRPKGVMLTHRNLYLHAMSLLASVPLDDTDVQLHTIPLFHVNGWGTPQYLTAVGGTHVMMRKFDPGDVLKQIEAERVTHFLAVPTMLTMILNHPDIGRYDLGSLKRITTGGSPTPPEMVRRAETMLGCIIMSGYGLTETSPAVTRAYQKSTRLETEQQRLERQASAGFPLIDVDLRIVDADGLELPWDGEHAGEIVIRGNAVMKGYWRDQEATDAIIQDGWLHTGDVAMIDPEGFVIIVDRSKDIIISGGENISSVEIENVLYHHPAVLESAVLAAPDEVWGEIPVAIVALRPGSAATEEEILDFCRTRLANYKVPRSVGFRESLPKGGTGKILKRQLREPYWQAASKQVH